MLKGRFFKLRVLLVTLLSVVLLSETVFADATRVNVVGVQQINTNWCWAASCEAIFRGPLGTDVDQTEIVRDIMGPYLPNAGASAAQMVRVFDDYGYSSISSSSFLNFATVKEEINAGRPIIANLAFRDYSNGHSVVITSYDTRDGINYIWYMDPHTGSEYMQAFNSFVSGYTCYFNGQTAFWKTTVYGFRRKQ